MILITGSSGLIGSEASSFFSSTSKVIGIDNNYRKVLFGDQGNTSQTLSHLLKLSNYNHFNCDIRDYSSLERIFNEFNKEITLILHCAAQPSHDWASKDPLTDFAINATGTLNLLELYKKYCPNATFIFTSTNKVYGDKPNQLDLTELETRYESSLAGISEEMSIDSSLHSLFGVSKAAADLAVQEYGRYFGLKTYCFRCGCLSGPNHSGVKLHGFLSYLIKCGVNNIEYSILGYKGKQVRDNIHSSDLVKAFNFVYRSPKAGGTVYNIGGGRESNVSILEAIKEVEKLTNRKFNYTITDTPRKGDHIWYITDNSKFKKDFPEWRLEKPVSTIIKEIFYSECEKLS